MCPCLISKLFAPEQSKLFMSYCLELFAQKSLEYSILIDVNDLFRIALNFMSQRAMENYRTGI